MTNDGNGDKRRSIPELSPETEAIFDRLIRAEIDEVIPYEEFENLLGRPVQAGKPNSAYANLKSAERKARNQYRLVFAPVRNTGIKCLNDNDVIQSSDAQSADQLRRCSHRHIKRLKCVDASELSPELRAIYDRARSRLTLVHYANSKRGIEKIAAKAKEAGRTLPLMKTMEALQS